MDSDFSNILLGDVIFIKHHCVDSLSLDFLHSSMGVLCVCKGKVVPVLN
jgi:hypothetical protein